MPSRKTQGPASLSSHTTCVSGNEEAGLGETSSPATAEEPAHQQDDGTNAPEKPRPPGKRHDSAARMASSPAGWPFSSEYGPYGVPHTGVPVACRQLSASGPASTTLYPTIAGSVAIRDPCRQLAGK